MFVARLRYGERGRFCAQNHFIMFRDEPTGRSDATTSLDAEPIKNCSINKYFFFYEYNALGAFVYNDDNGWYNNNVVFCFVVLVSSNSTSTKTTKIF